MRSAPPHSSRAARWTLDLPVLLALLVLVLALVLGGCQTPQSPAAAPVYVGAVVLVSSPGAGDGVDARGDVAAESGARGEVDAAATVPVSPSSSSVPLVPPVSERAAPAPPGR